MELTVTRGMEGKSYSMSIDLDHLITYEERQALHQANVRPKSFSVWRMRLTPLGTYASSIVIVGERVIHGHFPTIDAREAFLRRLHAAFAAL